MIEIAAKYEYVIKVRTEISRNTAKQLFPFTMPYDPGAGTTTLHRQFALDSGYKINKLPAGITVVGLGGNADPEYTVIPNLRLGGVDLGPVYAHVIQFHDDMADRTLGLLGMNVLSWFKIIQECHWNEKLGCHDNASLLLEPKFDINDVISLDAFMPFGRSHRFGSAFMADRNAN